MRAGAASVSAGAKMRKRSAAKNSASLCAPLRARGRRERVSTEVTVTHVERLNRWYMEVPASSDPQWRTAYWSALLTGTQIRQLATALLGAYTQLRSKRLKVGIVAGPLPPSRSDDDVERDLTPTA